MQQKLDIILPLYRPKSGWDAHVLEGITGVCRHFSGTDLLPRIRVVNDGSPLTFFPDEILKNIKDCCNGEFEFLTYERNHGKGYSLRFAVSKSDADYIVYTDGDFPFGWHGVVKAAEELRDGRNVVMGVRSSAYGKALSPARKLLSTGVRMMNQILLGLPGKFLDTQAGLKGFDAKGRDAFLATTVDTFIFDTEFILIAWKRGLNINTVPLELRPGLHFSRMGLKVVLRELFHFCRILLKYRFQKRQEPGA